MPSVFFLGATGYIGGAVLVALRKRYPSWPVHALVRNEAHHAAISTLGVTVVHGSLDDAALIEERAYEAEIVVNVASADDLPATEAILRGLKKRHEVGRPKGTLVHTSGVAVFADGTKEGKFYPEAKARNDINEDDIRAIKPTDLHGNVDVPILKAGEEGYLTTYIICPAGILGPNLGPVPALNVFINISIGLSQSFGASRYVGEGSAIFPFVRIDDTVDLYLLVLGRAAESKDVDTSPYARYYIPTADNISWKKVAETVGQVLHRLGVVPSAEPKSIPPSMLPPGMATLAGNVFVRGDRARSLGWSPRSVNLAADLDEGLTYGVKRLAEAKK